MQKATIQLETLTCPSCAQKIENASEAFLAHRHAEARERLPRADHHLPRGRIEPHHEERLPAADPEPAPLADRVANHALVPPEI